MAADSDEKYTPINDKLLDYRTLDGTTTTYDKWESVTGYTKLYGAEFRVKYSGSTFVQYDKVHGRTDSGTEIIYRGQEYECELADGAWKLHVNVSQEHRGRAWNLITPLLFALESPVTQCKLTLESSQPISLDAISNIHKDKPKVLNYETIKTNRLHNEGQVTIYIPYTNKSTGDIDAVAFLELAEKIATVLKENDISPNLEATSSSFKKINPYVSYRHEGVTYTAAVDVSSYNPDGLPDPIGIQLATSDLESIQAHINTITWKHRSFGAHVRVINGKETYLPRIVAEVHDIVINGKLNGLQKLAEIKKTLDKAKSSSTERPEQIETFMTLLQTATDKYDFSKVPMPDPSSQCRIM